MEEPFYNLDIILEVVEMRLNVFKNTLFLALNIKIPSIITGYFLIKNYMTKALYREKWVVTNLLNLIW